MTRMLSLDSPRWHELEHAYGCAADTPALLLQLRGFPRSGGDAEPWFSLWSSLAHQGDVYSASFAAVPHVVALLATDPKRCNSSYVQFPAWIEICRVRAEIDVPGDLSGAYVDAISALPALAVAWCNPKCDDGDLACVLAAVAIGRGHAQMAEAALELRDSNAGEAADWLIEHQ